MSRILPTNCRLFSNSHHQLFCAQPTLAYILSSTSSTPHTEFSFASPVSSATNPPSLSDFSSLPYRQVQTPGLSLRSFNAPRGGSTSNDKSWHTAGGEFVNEDLRIGGPILCAVPIVIMPLKPTAPELSRLINETPSFIEDAATIFQRFAVDNPDMDICFHRSKFYPEPIPIATISIIVRRNRLTIGGCPRDALTFSCRRISKKSRWTLPMREDFELRPATQWTRRTASTQSGKTYVEE